MKLFLSSLPPNTSTAPSLIQLIGKVPKDTTIALIENASDPYTEWTNLIQPALQSFGFRHKFVDLREYQNNLNSLNQQLADADCIWLGGGNTFYLRWILHKTGSDEIIKELVGKGVVYGGDSAGAIVAGPTLKHFETADDPNDAPEVLLDGLHFTDSVVVPHMDNATFARVIHDINDKFKADGYATVALGDAQALVVNGDTREVVE